MAKFKLKASLIPKLQERNVINPVTGKIKMRVTYRRKRITEPYCVEMDFLPSDVIETINDAAIAAIGGKMSPRLKVGTEWFISDPTVPWFDQTDEPATMQLTDDGVEVLIRPDRETLGEYLREEGLSVDHPVRPTQSTLALLGLAKEHKAQVSR